MRLVEDIGKIEFEFNRSYNVRYEFVCFLVPFNVKIIPRLVFSRLGYLLLADKC